MARKRVTEIFDIDDTWMLDEAKIRPKDGRNIHVWKLRDGGEWRWAIITPNASRNGVERTMEEAITMSERMWKEITRSGQ